MLFRSFDLSAGLSREERLSVEARYRATTTDWDRASEIYRTLFNFFPDSLDYGPQLACAQNPAARVWVVLPHDSDPSDEMRRSLSNYQPARTVTTLHGKAILHGRASQEAEVAGHY